MLARVPRGDERLAEPKLLGWANLILCFYITMACGFVCWNPEPGPPSPLICAFTHLQNHYVERLYRLYLYCAPMLFYGLWKVIAPLIDPKSKEKVQFVDKSNVVKLMTSHFSPESLPQNFGGLFQPVPIQEIWQMIEEQKPELKASA
uniref:CRAL-TRIO domain-containing protein n=1 Tax=Dunaliella tertiolecta TaxID=3047 RepID=A0A7S3QM48_DUNTE